MPPLEMSLKSCSIPFPMDPIIPAVPSKKESVVEGRKMFHGPPIFRSAWSKPGYFPFTHPKSKDIFVPPKREVTFLSEVTIYPVLHLHDYSPQEVNDTWYSKREIRALKQRSKQEAILQVNTTSNAHGNEQQVKSSNTHPLPLMDSTNNVNIIVPVHPNNGGEPTSTMRGLESKTSMGSLRKKRHRLQAWKAVFLEQRRQHLEGFYDPETLADVYFEVSEPCHVAANMVAMRDARDVQFQYMDDCNHPEELEKENQPHISRTTLADNTVPLNAGGRYRTLIALHNASRREQRSLTVEVV